MKPEPEPLIDKSGIDRKNVRYALSGFAVGIVSTVWMLPPEVLDIPAEEARNGNLVIAYYPITTSMLFLLFASLFGIFLTFRWNGERQSEITDYSNEQSSD